MHRQHEWSLNLLILLNHLQLLDCSPLVKLGLCMQLQLTCSLQIFNQVNLVHILLPDCNCYLYFAHKVTPSMARFSRSQRASGRPSLCLVESNITQVNNPYAGCGGGFQPFDRLRLHSQTGAVTGISTGWNPCHYPLACSSQGIVTYGLYETIQTLCISWQSTQQNAPGGTAPSTLR